MPITPFHFGLGAVTGCAGLRWYSFRAFCFANCLIDLEAIVRVGLGIFPLHGPLHSFLLASTVPVLLAIPLGLPLCKLGTAIWNRTAGDAVKAWKLPPVGGRIAMLTGAFAGGVTHVLLDGNMHVDLEPFWPWSKANAPWHGMVSTVWEHAVLVAVGMFGVFLFTLRARTAHARWNGAGGRAFLDDDKGKGR